MPYSVWPILSSKIISTYNVLNIPTFINEIQDMSRNNFNHTYFALSRFNVDKIMKQRDVAQPDFYSISLEVQRPLLTLFYFIFSFSGPSCSQSNYIKNILWFTLLDKNYSYKSHWDNLSWASSCLRGCMEPYP